MRSTDLLLWACLIPAALAGQRPDDRAPHPSRRFSLQYEGGPSLGGPGPGLAEQLRDAGFDDTSPSFCFFYCSGPISQPTVQAPGSYSGISARFALTPRVTLGLGVGATSLGGATGYRDSADPASVEYIVSDWNASILWTGVFWKPSPALRLGGGPAWYLLSNTDGSSAVSRLGLMLEGGVEAPAGRRFFLDLSVRAHFIPTKDVEHGITTPVTLRPKWSHAAILAGLGVRL